MSPLKPVKSLYDSSLQVVFCSLISSTQKCRESESSFQKLRKCIVDLLHGGIREKLVCLAMKLECSRIDDISSMCELLIDPSVKTLKMEASTSCNNKCLHCLQRWERFSKIEPSAIAGLQHLTMKLRVDHSSNGPRMPSYPIGFHKVLKEGLASNLRSLILHNVADNESLGLIGKHAKHLTHLDVTSSWLVDDTGIGELLLKGSTHFVSHLLNDLDNSDPTAILSLFAIPEESRNEPCNTLCEVKIQHTNTSCVSVILLLIFAKHLKSLGGFLYSRNIGDAIISVQSCKNAPETLALTELWDTALPYDKLVKLAQYLPHLSSLYTRAAWLVLSHDVIPNLSNLTADFDFIRYEPPFYNFLECSGASLNRLVLVDQVYSLDLVRLAQCCPQLGELVAKVNVEGDLKKAVPLKHLKTARLRMSSSSTFSWIMRNADNIKKFEVFLERDVVDNFDPFQDNIILEIISENVKSLKSIECLNIHLFWQPKYHNVLISCGNLSIETAHALCDACDSLQTLGDLDTWFYVEMTQVLAMAKYISRSNLNLQLLFGGKLYPSTA